MHVLTVNTASMQLLTLENACNVLVTKTLYQSPSGLPLHRQIDCNLYPRHFSVYLRSIPIQKQSYRKGLLFCTQFFYRLTKYSALFLIKRKYNMIHRLADFKISPVAFQNNTGVYCTGNPHFGLNMRFKMLF